MVPSPPSLLVLLLPPAHNPFCLSDRLAFPSPDPFRRPVTHCAGKSDFLFSQGSKLKAQPSRRMRSHILGLSADPRGPSSAARQQKNAAVAAVCPRENTSLTLPFLLTLPPHLPRPSSGLHVNHESHTDIPRWFQVNAEPCLCACVCQSGEGLLPIGSHMGRVGMN